MEEEANTCALAREPFDSQDLRLLSPMIGGLDPEGGVANVELTTPQLRPDQEESIPMATPVIVELGDSPESSEFDRGICYSPLDTSMFYVVEDLIDCLEYNSRLSSLLMLKLVARSCSM